MSEATPNTRRTPALVAEACLAAHKRKDWAMLRTLFHPEALIGTFAGGGRPEKPELALSRLRDAHQDFIYHADVAHMIELDEQAVLLDGRVQYRDAYGMADVERSWLYVVRDGLLYRSAMYRTQSEARNEYASRGPTLGVA